MVTRLRKESAIEDLESAKNKAAELGSTAFEAFEDDSHSDAVKEGQANGVLSEDSSSSSSSSDDSDSTSDDTSDSGDMDDFGSDSFDDDPSDDSDDTSSDEEEEDPVDDDAEEKEKEAEEEAEEEAKADEEEKSRTEALRNFVVPEGLSIRYRNESFMENATTFVNGVESGSYGFIAASLAFIGLRVTPFVLKGMYKVVLYTFSQSFSILGNMFDAIEKRIERHANRTPKQKEQLDLLRKELDEKIAEGYVHVPDREMDDDVTYLLGESPDLSQNLVSHSSVLSNQVAKFQNNLLSEFNNLKFIARARYLQSSFDAMKYMAISPDKMGFALTQNASEEEILVDQYAMDTHIGNVSLVAMLPKQGLDTWENIEKGYKQSRVYLVASGDQGSVSKPKAMSPQELQGFINSLESLIDASTQHQMLYNRILEQRSGVFNDIKALFVKLANDSFKSSFKNSTALPLQLKSTFVTKVYVVGAMDLHDHTARVIANGLSFASSVLKTYKAKT